MLYHRVSVWRSWSALGVLVAMCFGGACVALDETAMDGDDEEPVGEVDQAVITATYNGSTFYFQTGSKTWAQAQADCVSLGGSLATINDANEAAWLRTQELATLSSTQPWWIGLSDQASEGTFVYASGEAMTYRNWNSSEPSNSGGIEDCVVDNGGGTGSGKWNDIDCAQTRPYICEVGSNKVCGNGRPDPGEECDDGNTTDTDSCRNDCTINNGSKYYFVLTPMTWAAAQSNCQGLGGSLASINGSTEEAWLDAKELLNGTSTQTWWIGGSDSTVEGTFAWASGQPFTYTNWNTGAPNNGGTGGNEDCVIDNASGTKKWNDIDCSNTRTFICEVAQSSFCGNGIVEAGETCDDGNRNNTDACNNTCSGAGFTYFFSTTAKTWQEARFDCLERGGALATVNNQAEEDALAFQEFQRDPNAVWWVGLNDLVSEGTFVWNTSASVSYTNWMAGEPNNLNGGEDCVADNHSGSGKWNDFPCSNTYRYICEFSAAPACGNAILEFGEQCDDGNTNDSDACKNDCTRPAGSTAYYFGTTPASWYEAQTDCSLRGGSLVTVSNQAEEDMLQTEETSRVSGVEWWLGRNDRVTEGTFVWASGMSSSYTNFYPGEPNSAGGENCVEDNAFGSQKWNDLNCSWLRRYICEIF